MTIGTPGVFAIESRITHAYDKLSLRALGCFLIYVAGFRYGVDADDATMLANSYDGVLDRTRRRGTHRVVFAQEDAIDIADAVSASLYADCGQRQFFGFSQAELAALLTGTGVLWAPDGDEAFDDGSHVLQFDVDDRVRLLGFRRESGTVSTASVSDIWLPEEQFYSTLQTWRNAFDKEWELQPKLATR
ncbi:MAG: hypothetical protein IT168_24425 [Bryobacterales bacterium]|nr:hypothetical protein [Bryobacterales bacterium]